MTAAPDSGGEGLRRFFRRSASGVWVVTTTSPDGRPVGFTASSVTSVALDPAVFALSLQAGSSSWPAVEAASGIMVHALSDADEPLARRFASSGVDRFAGVDWHPGEGGLPVLPGVNGRLRGEILTVVPVGESRLLLCGAMDADLPDVHRPPLVHHDRAYWRVTDT